MAVANKLEKNKKIFKQKYFRQVSGCSYIPPQMETNTIWAYFR